MSSVQIRHSSCPRGGTQGRSGLGFDSPHFHSWGCPGFDGLAVTSMTDDGTEQQNRNNIVSFNGTPLEWLIRLPPGFLNYPLDLEGSFIPPLHGDCDC